MKLKMLKSPLLFVSVFWGVHLFVVLILFYIGATERVLMINFFASLTGGITMILMSLTNILKVVVAILNHLVINDINNANVKISQQLSELEKEIKAKSDKNQ